MNPTHREVREQMERVRQQLRALVAEGRADEAIELALKQTEPLSPERETMSVPVS